MEDLTVDPQKQGDPFYRYKMPPLATKVEGKGNGIKTVLPNIAEICLQLKRNPEYPVKYFGTDLGANTKWKDDKWIIMGEHDQPKLQKSLFGYIVKFVLCKKCRNPETQTYLNEKKNAFLHCTACGKDSPLDMGEKIMNLIIKNEHQILPQAKKEKKHKKGDADDKVEVDHTVASQTRVLVTYIESADPPPGPTEVALKLNAIKSEHGYKKKDLAKVLSGTVFAHIDNFATVIDTYAPTLRKFISDSTEKYLFEAAEMLVIDRHPDCASRVFPAAVELLLEKKVVSPEGVLDWHEGKPNKANKELSASNRGLCSALVAKLESAVEAA